MASSVVLKNWISIKILLKHEEFEKRPLIPSRKSYFQIQDLFFYFELVKEGMVKEDWTLTMQNI